MSDADVENGEQHDSIGLLAQKPNPGLKFEKKYSETERSTRVCNRMSVDDFNDLQMCKHACFVLHVVEQKHYHRPETHVMSFCMLCHCLTQLTQTCNL